jgi:hypothetical protein
VLPEFAQVLRGEEDLAPGSPHNERPPNGQQPDEQPTREGSDA